MAWLVRCTLEDRKTSKCVFKRSQVDGWTLPFAILVNDGREAQQHNGSVKLDVKVAKVVTQYSQ